MDSNSNQDRRQEKAKKINQIFKDSSQKIEEVGLKAVSLLRDLKKRKEQEKIEELSKDLKG